MDTVKVNLAAMNVKLDGIEKSLSEKIETSRNAAGDVAAKVQLVQAQLNKQEESNRQLKADNAEMKKSLNEIMKQLERMTQLTSHEVQAEEMKKGIAEGGEVDREPKVVIAGGSINGRNLNSVEVFSLSKNTWTPLRPMKECRNGPSSVVYNNQLFVIGGYVTSIETLSLNAIQLGQSLVKENVAVELPGPLAGHCSVIYKGQVIIIGGYNADKHARSDSITEISLVPPYTSKLLATMPQRRCYHGVAIFGDKILIVGGRESGLNSSSLRSVVTYEITKNDFQELAPLPYPLCKMATVKWGDDNVILMGGGDSNGRPLNKVLMYNIKTQKCHALPNMKYKREGCVAAVVRDTVIVMGGRDKTWSFVKSVESFRFDRYSWEELLPMNESRWKATAAVC